ncbi:ImmA/IrrE family metallo-endopeptidase [Rhodococcus sp. SGAir0479]|uniref:ImmA/IrrE family metallo-endopeptidase n=1 Tax=Rhodococcus sp. SGAir0479 TaxID=2567884 RepID=UPI0010CD35BE|nr:ImmA/IrrE family metallo-endopeptidase [Rhodococcus sp. SGAir0479]QCQ89975.1 ImmA/IrrE family metallo-endopeptidase [Rhodococcus sp. SGAir0479]
MARRSGNKRYDARVQAATLGVTIGHVGFAAPIVIWQPKFRAILVTADLTTVDRREALAHALAHAQLEHSETVRKARAGRESRQRVELRVYELACRNLIPIAHLRDALARYTSVEDVAGWLQVNPDTVRYRLQYLSHTERRVLTPDIVNRLDWYADAKYPLPVTCIWTNSAPLPAYRKLPEVLRRFR